MNRSYISDGVLVKYEKESSKLRMSGGAWSVNVDKFDLESINRIVYITEGYRYDISKDDAISVGYFRSLGGENKLVVPISKWNKEPK
tara:strand:+ start:786 stop:1046 length:261 start_codon:yes stop_codon:yes gene_type:complete